MKKTRALALGMALLLGMSMLFAACGAKTPQNTPSAVSPSPAVSAAAGNASLSGGMNAVEAADKIGLSLIPSVKQFSAGEGSFVLTQSASICVWGNDEAQTEVLLKTGEYLAQRLRTATGYALAVKAQKVPSDGDFFLTTAGGDAAQGEEGYFLQVTKLGVTVAAYTPQGVFYGTQTLRQLFPAQIEEQHSVMGVTWAVPCVEILDAPTYLWRGMMLDVARHFFGVEDVKRVIDLLAQFKMNRLHLHLSDDQGWRIEIKAYPELSQIGANTAVGGDAGGYYTQEQYQQIVAYAAERYVTVVPEIDMPGHVNAALASVAELNPSGERAKPRTDVEVGYSGFSCRSETTYVFVDAVLRELAAITPGEYVHIGGDEAGDTSDADYSYFMSRVNGIAASYGKKTIGWSPFDTAEGVSESSALQFWAQDPSQALKKGMKLIVSPPDRAYIDMKYDEQTPIGLKWAGYISTETSYSWSPLDYVPQSAVLGIECPLWTETVRTMDDIEYLAFPRLLSHAEIGWTNDAQRAWNEYRKRLAAFAPRLAAQDVGYYEDPAVPWN